MSLTDTASFSRKAFRWVLLFVGIIFALLILFFAGRGIKNLIFPPSPLPPSVAFGKLPKLDLSEGVKPSNNIQFNIETISGNLPVLDARAKIFKISPGDTTFGGVEKIKSLAANLGFGSNPQGSAGNIYEFIDTKVPGRTFSISITNLNFNLDSEFYNQTNLIGQNPGSEKSAVDAANNLFSAYNFDINDFPREKVRTRMLRIDGKNLVEVPSLAGANIIEVVFTRSDIDKLEVISPSLDKPPAVAYVTNKKIVRAKLQKQDIELSEFATYPLKGTQSAFEDLKAGKGAINKQPVENVFPIREVKLGYLENAGPQDFLQPVYLFKSDNGLIAYVSAVSDLWTK